MVRKLLLYQRFLTAYFVTICAANTTTQMQASRKAINECRNPDATSVPDPTCWETLQMSAWMSNWNSSTSVCTTTQDLPGSCQCIYEEDWATCFMRLTFGGNFSARYSCTNITTPQNCSQPFLDDIVQGPTEIFYGAYSIWGLVQYFSTWYSVIISPSAMPAIKAELASPKTSGLSINTLFDALLQNYAIDIMLSAALRNLTMTSSVDTSDRVRPTLQNAQLLLGDLLQSILTNVTNNWSSGDFLQLAASGMLLNSTGETPEALMGRLSEE